MAEALSLGLAHSLRIEAPYATLEKSEIIRRGAALAVPFELTLSCMKPISEVQGLQGGSKGSLRAVQQVSRAP